MLGKRDANASLLLSTNALKIVMSYPKTIFLVVNSVCNLHCKMCDLGQNNLSGMFHKVLAPIGRPELPLDRLDTILDEVLDWQPTIAVTSSEPLLYKPLYNLIRLVKKRGFSFQLTTNALLLPQHAERLAQSGIDQLWISIDGPPHVHDCIRGKNGLWNNIAKGIKIFLKSRGSNSVPKLHVNYAISNHNYNCLTDTLDHFCRQAWPIDSIVFSHLNFVTPEMARLHNLLVGEKYPAYASCLSDADPFSVDLDCLFEQLKSVEQESPFPVHFSPRLDRAGLELFYRDHGQAVSTPGCKALMHAVQILADGNVTGSTRCFRISLGNVFEQSLTQIWNGLKRKTMLRDISSLGLFPACLRCCGAF